MRIAYTGFAAVIGLALVACASGPVPTEHLALAQAAVRAAKELDARNVPQAQLHAQLAQEQLDQAAKLIDDGDNERAEMVLRRAQADAEMAVALAREESSKKQAEAAEAALTATPATPNPTMQATNQ